MITINGYKLEPTIFPDKTSQVWKLPKHVLDAAQHFITWHYQSEQELMHLAQLKQLIDLTNAKDKAAYLYMPYLPYARQDKYPGNNSSWSLSAFAKILNSLEFDSINVLDAHNPSRSVSLIDGLVNVPPFVFHSKVIDHVQPEIIIFPDLGAYNRYPHLHHLTYAMAEKERDAASGKIVKYTIDGTDFTKYKTALVVDDLCDGGATFLKLREALPVGFNLALAVTHGVFSKGTHELYCAGYRMFTTDSYMDSADKNFVTIIEA